MSNQQLDSRRRRRVLAGIGVATVGAGLSSTAVAGQEDTTVEVTLDNAGISAWQITSVDGADDVGPTGEDNPQLTLSEGVRYTFVNNGGSSHPLAFYAGDNETLLSQSDDGSFEGDSETDWVDDGGSVSFTLTSELADEMASYACTVHSAMTGSIETTQEGPAATVTFADQSTTGTSVVVDSAELTDGGFVTIHDSNLLDGDALGSVIGVSDYLDSGSYENLTVELDDPLTEGDTLVAMPHRDTDGDESYSFVESEGGTDGPYVVEGDPVTDDADVQVDGAAAVQMRDQTTMGGSVTVDFARLDDGGFVTIHDSTLLDGEPLGSVIGVSEYLDAGTYENVTVSLDEELAENDTLVAMPHRDTDGDESCSFVESEGGADGPYTFDGGAVTDAADVTVQGTATVSFSDQETDGTTVVVDTAMLDDGGFVTIHDSTLLDGDALGSVVGVSEYLQPGSYEDLEITLNEELTEDDTLVAMPHRDTDGDESYSFVESEGGTDGPYVADGSAVIAQAEVTVLGDATVSFSDQETDGMAVLVDSAELDDGGFVTIHDSTLLDGDALGSVVGVSEYLQPGSYEDLEIVLDEEMTEDDTLVAMPHRDTNGNEEYDFVESEGGADGPYLNGEGSAVVDDATVTVTSEMDDGMDGDMDGGMDDEDETDETESADGDGPGFGPVAGIAGLSGVATYLYRTLGVDDESGEN
ncbi:hypothetical protein SAMN05216226_102253 [Halovenus aranensis]|uniref:DUF7282 domain-containing protein n=1 Tax=Halovenus aranensis TaxID=890420 RepID=A0A1G8T0M4_9EURY|nr:PGF-CTERM sorting domain-containing protein [Halovenus aranensis]SDJ35058.1 hypothetical protein SAMN05216226_102253 [Halovenus aranensis]